MKYAVAFQARSTAFAAAALRLDAGGSLAGFARFYAILAEQERAIELQENPAVPVTLRGASQEDALMNEGGADDTPDNSDRDGADCAAGYAALAKARRNYSAALAPPSIFGSSSPLA